MVLCHFPFFEKFCPEVPFIHHQDQLSITQQPISQSITWIFVLLPSSNAVLETIIYMCSDLGNLPMFKWNHTVVSFKTEVLWKIAGWIYIYFCGLYMLVLLLRGGNMLWQGFKWSQQTQFSPSRQKENVVQNRGWKSVPKEKKQALEREIHKATLKSCTLYVFCSTGDCLFYQIY